MKHQYLLAILLVLVCQTLGNMIMYYDNGTLYTEVEPFVLLRYGLRSWDSIYGKSYHNVSIVRGNVTNEEKIGAIVLLYMKDYPSENFLLPQPHGNPATNPLAYIIAVVSGEDVPGYAIYPCDNDREMKAYDVPVFQITNKTFTQLYYNFDMLNGSYATLIVPDGPNNSWERLSDAWWWVPRIIFEALYTIAFILSLTSLIMLIADRETLLIANLVANILQIIAAGISIFVCIDFRDLFLTPEYLNIVFALSVIPISTASSVVICYYWHLVLKKSGVEVNSVVTTYYKGLFGVAIFMVSYTVLVVILFLVFKNNRTQILIALSVITAFFTLVIGIFYFVTAIRLIKQIAKFSDEESVKRRKIINITVVMLSTCLGFLFYILAVLAFGLGIDNSYHGSAFAKIDVRLAPLLIVFTQSAWLYDVVSKKFRSRIIKREITRRTQTQTQSQN